MFSEKETIREDQSEARSQRIALDGSSSEKLENAFLELKKEHVKLTRSQLASEAVIFYFDKNFSKQRNFIKTKYFDAQKFLKKEIGNLKTKNDLERILKETLAKGKNRGRKKQD